MVYQQLCRPSELPRRRVRLFNAVDPRWLWRQGVPSEREAVVDFARWYTRVARGAPLIAYNSSFDRTVLRGALTTATGDDDGEPFPWGPCLMKDAARLLGGKRGKMPKEEAARQVLDVDVVVKQAAREIGHRGPITMHLGLPDVLLEGALMVALRQRELSAAA